MTEKDADIEIPEALPCPFCGWVKIRVIEEAAKEGMFKGSLYTYCWCRVCGTKGPWAYNVKDDDRKVYDACVKRWNERTND